MKSAKNILRQYLKNNGLLQSKQREQILDIFLETEEHPTIGDLYELVRKKTPKIGLATVYRTVRRFEHEYRHQHHDHLVCLKCGRIIEVMSPEIEKLQQSLAKKHRFTAVRHRLEIFGTCRTCKRKKTQS
jgi:Fur family ferric uptake transcriptional regulator